MKATRIEQQLEKWKQIPLFDQPLLHETLQENYARLESALECTKAVLSREIELRKVAQDTIKMRDEFLAVATHELRTPLTTLHLVMQSFKKFFNHPEAEALPDLHAHAKMYDLAVRQIGKLARLVDDLVDVSRITTGSLSLKLECFDLAASVQHILELHQDDLKKMDCEIKLDIQEKIIGVWDRVRIEQVFTNLLCNAIKFGKGKPIFVQLKATDKTATLIVQDYGIGIKKDDLDRIFKRFERAVPAQQFDGLGLGLYIVDQIVTAHHGSIKVKSEPKKGSKFIVTLPLVQDKLLT